MTWTRLRAVPAKQLAYGPRDRQEDDQVERSAPQMWTRVGRLPAAGAVGAGVVASTVVRCPVDIAAVIAAAVGVLEPEGAPVPAGHGDAVTAAARVGRPAARGAEHDPLGGQRGLEGPQRAQALGRGAAGVGVVVVVVEDGHGARDLRQVALGVRVDAAAALAEERREGDGGEDPDDEDDDEDLGEGEAGFAGAGSVPVAHVVRGPRGPLTHSRQEPGAPGVAVDARLTPRRGPRGRPRTASA